MRMYSSYRTQVDFNHLHDLYEQYTKFGDYCSVLFFFSLFPSSFFTKKSLVICRKCFLILEVADRHWTPCWSCLFKEFLATFFYLRFLLFFKIFIAYFNICVIIIYLPTGMWVFWIYLYLFYRPIWNIPIPLSVIILDCKKR